ncbi:MAG: nucleotidyltransferase family protein [Elusimicrobiales bacterium]
MTDYNTAARNILLMREADLLSRECARGGFDVIFLKGAALLARGMCGPHERTMSDLDVIVSPENRTAARRALARLGYRKLDGVFQAYGKGRAIADLHTELWHADYAALRAEAQWAESENGRLLVPSAEDMALHVVAHAMLHQGGFPPRARRDFAFIAAKDFNWEKFRLRAAEFGMKALAASAIACGKTPAPPEMADKFALAPLQRPMLALFLRAARGDGGVMYEYILPAAYKPALVWRAAFPPAHVLEEKMKASPVLRRVARPLNVLLRACRRIFESYGRGVVSL